MYKTCIPLIASVLFFSFHSAEARKSTVLAHRCSNQIYKTVVLVSSQQNGFNVNNQISSRKLNEMSVTSAAGDYVIGLTSVQSITKIDADGITWQDEETGGECYAPRIEISLTYQPLQIYIGKEFLPDTCAYKAILEHEMKHVRIYQNYLPKVEENLRVALQKRFSSFPLYGVSGQTKQALDNELDNFWRPLIKSELSKVELDQHQLDNEEELARVSWACIGEVQSILGFRYH